MNILNSFDKKVRTDIVFPVFADGMVVTANDLNRAMHYPVELFQTLVRSFFGCGVVCGLSVEHYSTANNEDSKWCLVVHPGTALDCHGNPLKVCDRQILSLKPEPCYCGDLPENLWIALRRCVVKEGPRDDADICDDQTQSDTAYGRAREYVEVKVFDPNDCDLPELCVKEANHYKPSQVCDCLKDCPDPCCGESWVVLACVTLDECEGITNVVDYRKFVKPVHCHCLPVEEKKVDKVKSVSSTPKAAASKQPQANITPTKEVARKKATRKKSTRSRN